MQNKEFNPPEFGRVYNCNFLNNNLPGQCASLIIADPPYYEVKGEFDFIWANFADYLADVELWAKECKRLLAHNGTLLWYGHAKKIAYSQIILDKYFNLMNSLVWEKIDCQNRMQDFEQSRCFAPVTERILMYSNEAENPNISNELYAENIKVFAPIIEYMKSQKECIKKHFNFVTDAQFNEFVNNATETSSVVSKHYFCYSQWCFPTEKLYTKLKEAASFAFPREYEHLRREYEHLRREYEHLRRPFDNSQKHTDVLKFSQEAHITKNYDHDTKKPETLTRMLIQTCSRPNDLIIAPFSGSGTEVAMAIKEGRRAIGFDLNLKYCEMANQRIKSILDAPQLF